MRELGVILLATLAATPVLASGGDGGNILGECVAFAPLAVDCDVGTFDLDGTIYLGYTIYPCYSLLLYPASCLAADVEVVATQLDAPFDRVSVVCSLIFLPGYNYIDEPDGCRSPRPVDFGGRVMAECHARRLHTTDPSVPGSGEPLGAVGEFGCFVADR